LRDELFDRNDYHLIHNVDTEVIQHYLSYALRNDIRPDLAQVFGMLGQKFDGAYSIAYLNAMGDMAIVRDPKGFRPLCYAIEGCCKTSVSRISRRWSRAR
jgi:amidophosphoribosyltransferase